MAKLSPIYGADDNDFAQGIAADALRNTSGKEDIWGATLDQSAMSHGTSKGTTDDTNPVVIVKPNTGDSRATTKGNHGAQG